MDIKKLEEQARKDFNNAMWVVALSHIWVLAYLLAGRTSSYGILTIRERYILFITMTLLLTGIIIARKIIWVVTARLLDSNQRTMELQEKLVEKSKLSAITETALTLSHEINNPLMIMRGNIEMLEGDFEKADTRGHIKDKLVKIKNHCERIRQITDRLANLSNPAEITIHGDTKMIDADGSE